MRLDGFTLIVPFYRNVAMLAEQLRAWAAYPEAIRFIVVDDGSPEPALPIIERLATPAVRARLALYRIGVDIKWNRNGARNLGALQAETDWTVHVDIDHVLPPASALAMIGLIVDEDCWYRFPRYRNGKADETRRKDALPPDQEFGPVKPHCDSYLCTRALYWRAGGYDEDYSGALGGGSPFLKALERLAPPGLLPEPIALHVFTRSTCPDASDFSLSRDTSEFSRRRKDKERRGDTRPKNPIRFPWERLC